MSTHSEAVAHYPASFNDGKSAATVEVSTRPESAALIIVNQAGTEIGRWTWEDIHLVEKVTKGRPVRLANRSLDAARLTYDDPAVLSILETHAPYLRRAPLTKRRLANWAAVVAVCGGIVAFLIYGLPIIARPIASLVPIAWEERIGDETVDIINRMFASGRKACESKKGTAALDTLSARLARTVDTPYKIHVSVMDSKVVNAFAVPGGRIVLFRGLIEKATSPEEVAGVLAHELAHVVERHPTQGMITSIGWSAV
ncbi:MAG: M48 family metallopeptidase, partial [Alphaproteobacteria bacterium]|nr:M48 family metallopeptidase [Alphaproteobacteria bacterium]